MRHRRRVSDQAFHAAQRFREGEDLNRFDKATHSFQAADDFEAQHGAEPGLLALGDGVAGMRCETRIVNDAHLRMLVPLAMLAL